MKINVTMCRWQSLKASWFRHNLVAISQWSTFLKIWLSMCLDDRFLTFFQSSNPYSYNDFEDLADSQHRSVGKVGSDVHWKNMVLRIFESYSRVSHPPIRISCWDGTRDFCSSQKEDKTFRRYPSARKILRTFHLESCSPFSSKMWRSGQFEGLFFHGPAINHALPFDARSMNHIDPSRTCGYGRPWGCCIFDCDLVPSYCQTGCPINN
jgi:hypothetical protein